MPRTPLPTRDDLVTLDELCEMGFMGKDNYRHMRRAGKTPPAIKIGRRLYFRKKEAEDWVRNVRMVSVS